MLHTPPKKKKLSSKCEAFFLVRELAVYHPLPKNIAPRPRGRGTSFPRVLRTVIGSASPREETREEILG